MHKAQIRTESVLFVCPALSFVKSPLHFHHAALQGGHFVFWFRIPPGLNLSEIHARGRGGLQPGASRDCRPPWGPPESRPRRWEFRTAKCESRPRHSDFFTAKRESRQRRSPLPGRAFSAARPAGTARFLITRGKASFYETATFGRRKVFFCSPFCGLLFCPARAKLALPAGEKPAAPKPRPPRGGPPNDCDRLPVFAPPARTPAPATPPQSACSRRLSGCPQRPNLSARRRAESPKGKRKGGTPMKRAPPL